MRSNKAANLAIVSWIVIAGFFVFLAAVPPKAAAQSISISSPNSSSVWTKGIAYAITWSWTIGVGPNVKIEYDYAFYSSPTVIAASTSNDGSYLWTVPTGISSRSDYFIRISDVSNLTIFDDSDFFEITGSSGLGDITVTNPDVLDYWETGKTYSITWTATGGVGPFVKIEYECLICSSDGVVVASTPTSDGSYSWTVPTSLTVNQYYQIRVSDAANLNVYDDSDPFYVKTGPGAVSSMAAILAMVVIIVIVVVIVVVIMAASKKKPAAPPAQANIPVAPPPIQYAPPPTVSPQTYVQQRPYTQPPVAPSPQAAPQPPQAGAMKVCRYCGRSIPVDFTFCVNC